MALLSAATSDCARVAPRPPDAASVAWRPARPALARFITTEEHGRALWAVGPVLGSLQLKTANNELVVTLPRNEEVACAAWSQDGSLLAAAGKHGSLSLWAADGTLLADWPGSQRLELSCGSYSFQLAPATKRVVATLGYSTAALFGPGLATTLTHAESTGVVSASFSPDGRRVFAQIASDRVGVYDATTGKRLGQLPDMVKGLPRFSPKGRYFTLSRDGEQTELYESESLRPLPAGAPEVANNLDILQLFDPFDAPAYDASGAFRVGSTDTGYGVFDVRSGIELASWPASGLGCGYEWDWHEGKLIFVEGTLVTFWSHGSGARTTASECHGALVPLFTKARSRVIALDGVWDTATQQLLARLDMPSGAEVWGLSRDERLVLGSVALSTAPDSPTWVGWDIRTGHVVWQARPLLGITPLNAWPFIDERSGKEYWLTHVIDPEHGLTPLVFDKKCWAGPSRLPHDSGLPPAVAGSTCPGLLPELRELMQSRGFAVPVQN